jgi:phosphoglycerate dehydrogenase-like enzyme
VVYGLYFPLSTLPYTEILREATALMTFGVVPDPSDAPNLCYIHFAVAGTDHVAHKPAFKDPNITITTSTGGSSIAAAEWIIGSVLGLTRQLFQFKELQNARTWGSSVLAPPPFTLDGKKMGIIGYGSIGRQGDYRSFISYVNQTLFAGSPLLTFGDLSGAFGTGSRDGHCCLQLSSTSHS